MVTLARPQAAQAMTLPGRYYADPAIFALEQQRIFSSSWVCVGRAEQLREPGSYVLAGVGAEDAIVLRDRQGELRAFLNVCRHRGARICTAAQGTLRNSMQCRYHAWTFGLDGRLLGAPNMKDDPGFDAAEHGLLPVALELWEGLIWLNLSESPAPLAEQLGVFHDLYARYRIGSLAAGGTVTYEVRSNWKLIVENFSECCHCAIAHPELSAQVPSFKSGIVTGTAGGGATFGEGVQSLTMDGKTSRPFFPGISEEDRSTYYGEILRPNVFLNLQPDYVVIHTMQPLAADHTRITCHWLFEPATIAAPGFDAADAVDFWDLVNRQDWDLCESAQLGMRSRAYRQGGVYAPMERHIRSFNDYVLDRLGHRDGATL